jgi:hypothetical protein
MSLGVVLGTLVLLLSLGLNVYLMQGRSPPESPVAGSPSSPISASPAVGEIQTKAATLPPLPDTRSEEPTRVQWSFAGALGCTPIVVPAASLEVDPEHKPTRYMRYASVHSLADSNPTRPNGICASERFAAQPIFSQCTSSLLLDAAATSQLLALLPAGKTFHPRRWVVTTATPAYTPSTSSVVLFGYRAPNVFPAPGGVRFPTANLFKVERAVIGGAGRCSGLVFLKLDRAVPPRAGLAECKPLSPDAATASSASASSSSSSPLSVFGAGYPACTPIKFTSGSVPQSSSAASSQQLTGQWVGAGSEGSPVFALAPAPPSSPSSAPPPVPNLVGILTQPNAEYLPTAEGCSALRTSPATPIASVLPIDTVIQCWAEALRNAKKQPK